MPLVSKHSLHQLAVLAWGLVVFGATILVFSGQAAPLVSPSQLPVNGPFALFGTAAGLWILGAVVVGQFEKRSWKRTGRRTGLSPEGRGLFGKPDLVGSVRGRSVRTHTVKRRTGSSGEGGSNKTAFTVVEVALPEPADAGLVVSPTGGAGLKAGNASVDVAAMADEVDGFAAVGDPEGLAREVLTDRAREALREPDRLDAVYAGNAADVLLEAVPDASGRLAGALTDGIKSKLADRLPGDAATVRTERKGVLLDGAELERQVEALAVVADEFEAATAGDASGWGETAAGPTPDEEAGTRA